MNISHLKKSLQDHFGPHINNLIEDRGELTIEIPHDHLKTVATTLRDAQDLRFEMLMDVCGVDYLEYGKSEWRTHRTTKTGFDRGVNRHHKYNVNNVEAPSRFASVYQLLSLTHNHRLRIRVFVPEKTMTIDSVVDIWPSANWFEREAYDLFGIMYQGHPDLRRILTDYGFIGHPFRKDFPLSGHVEVRYDAKEQRVVYEPVDIKPRTLVPKVIRQD